jgi:hypothetical protein
VEIVICQIKKYGTMVSETCGQDYKNEASSTESLCHSLWVGMIGGVPKSSALYEPYCILNAV